MIGLRLHHIGIVVADIAATSEEYVRRMGYVVCSEIIHDPVQTAHVQFLRLRGDHTLLELVSPDGPQSALSNALRKGGGLNHLCYETSDIDAALAGLWGQGLRVIRPPVPAVAFHGNRIAWLMGRDRVLIELVELKSNGARQEL